MKHSLVILFAFLTLTGWAKDDIVISQRNGYIAFEVDKGLTPIRDKYKYLGTGEQLAGTILYEETSGFCKALTTSFANDQCMKYTGNDAFYGGLKWAYANHMSVTISPDMIWLLISQGFARYVNAHPEEMRQQLVSHDGKLDLVVKSQEDLFSEKADWPTLISDFTAQIDSYTKNDIAKTITADFTTTTPAERIASQITLMESVKKYFTYTVMRVACGIPSIAITGTSDDWRQVMAKTKKLEVYNGIGKWAKSLEPLLQEFVNAVEGKPNQKFWQDIVKKDRVNKLKGGGCTFDTLKMLDGWILKFFPDENGLTQNSVAHTVDMPSELIRVGFNYKVLSSEDGSIEGEAPMELWAGFVGAEVDTLSNMLSPKIGWMVTYQDKDLTPENMKKSADKSGLSLVVKEVPEVLATMKHLKQLKLKFTDDVVIPDWFYNLKIDYLTIEGIMSKEIEDKIKQHFPDAYIRRFVR
ncbi:MAG: DUF4419 domain-containing protein [Bacteroidaceae bacterium]|nr:DUF4419 domain-containing protein [Bacteroidaceae bacterium]